MVTLDAVQLLFVHWRLASSLGYAASPVDSAALVSALRRAAALTAASGDVFRLAAHTALNLVQTRPFAKGTVPAALAAAALTLRANGFHLQAPPSEVARIGRRVAAGHVAPEELADWLRTRSVAADP